MAGRVIGEIFALKSYMAGTVVLTLILCAIYLMSLRFFKFGGRGFQLHGLFIGLSLRQELMLSALYLRLLFVLWCIFSMRFDRLIFLVYLLGLGAMLSVLKGNVKQIMAEAVNSILLLLGLYTAGLLAAYMREIRFEWNIMAVYVLLSSFMALYTLYFFLRDVKLLSESRTGLWMREAGAKNKAEVAAEKLKIEGETEAQTVVAKEAGTEARVGSGRMPNNRRYKSADKT